MSLLECYLVEDAWYFHVEIQSLESLVIWRHRSRQLARYTLLRVAIISVRMMLLKKIDRTCVDSSSFCFIGATFFVNPEAMYSYSSAQISSKRS
ncbi:hypothetical protein PAXRUDRAFT_552963 [Paxillus rubicundulus Ve08.2h10]|uniref:Uncharacterized protein n=1 Tax=Paxillus rubicundulus Ve08.2h10 TaxID=930991 RepID=A0A0D0DW01_9AGAM|nr:hypothetical protein PAXRUDRAFT_552963 [Paxillus rubicundulus Ve08.2h10]